MKSQSNKNSQSLELTKTKKPGWNLSDYANSKNLLSGEEMDENEDLNTLLPKELIEWRYAIDLGNMLQPGFTEFLASMYSVPTVPEGTIPGKQILEADRQIIPFSIIPPVAVTLNDQCSTENLNESQRNCPCPQTNLRYKSYEENLSFYLREFQNRPSVIRAPKMSVIVNPLSDVMNIKKNQPSQKIINNDNQNDIDNLKLKPPSNIIIKDEFPITVKEAEIDIKEELEILQEACEETIISSREKKNETSDKIISTNIKSPSIAIKVIRKLPTKLIDNKSPCLEQKNKKTILSKDILAKNDQKPIILLEKSTEKNQSQSDQEQNKVKNKISLQDPAVNINTSSKKPSEQSAEKTKNPLCEQNNEKKSSLERKIETQTNKKTNGNKERLTATEKSSFPKENNKKTTSLSSDLEKYLGSIKRSESSTKKPKSRLQEQKNEKKSGSTENVAQKGNINSRTSEVSEKKNCFSDDQQDGETSKKRIRSPDILVKKKICVQEVTKTKITYSIKTSKSSQSPSQSSIDKKISLSREYLREKNSTSTPSPKKPISLVREPSRYIHEDNRSESRNSSSNSRSSSKGRGRSRSLNEPKYNGRRRSICGFCHKRGHDVTECRHPINRNRRNEQLQDSSMKDYNFYQNYQQNCEPLFTRNYPDQYGPDHYEYNNRY